MKGIEILNLIDMLRKLDIEKNDKKTIKEVLNFIADKLEDLIEEVK